MPAPPRWSLPRWTGPRVSCSSPCVSALSVDVLVPVVEGVDALLGNRNELAALARDVYRPGDVLAEDRGLDGILRGDADRERAVVAHQHGARPVAAQGLDDAAPDRVVADDRERADRDRTA